LSDTKGGAERQVYEFLKRFDRGRFEPFLFVVHQGDVPREIVELGIPAQGLGIRSIYDFKGLARGRSFAKFLKENRIDIVLTYHFSSDIWGTFWARRAGVPVIISSRRDVGFWRNRNHIIAYKFVNSWVSKIIAVSGAVKRMVVEEEGVETAKVVVVHNGVDLGRFEVRGPRSEVRKTLNLADDDMAIGCVANFSSKTKGHEILIRAIHELVVTSHQSPVTSVKVLLIGDGPLRENLQSSVDSLQLKDKFIFLGKRDDVREILAACDMCVLPSLSEGMSNALLEFMAAGKPVVATAVGGNLEVITDGKDGLLVPAGDAAALANGIKVILQDQGLAQRLGAAARKTVEERFDLGKQLKRLEDVLVGEYSPLPVPPHKGEGAMFESCLHKGEGA
jgi:glycosyltransferase involved in cell wall biosynthesis